MRGWVNSPVPYAITLDRKLKDLLWDTVADDVDICDTTYAELVQLYLRRGFMLPYEMWGVSEILHRAYLEETLCG